MKLLFDIILLLLDNVLVESDDQLVEKLGVVQVDLRHLRLRRWLLLLHRKNLRFWLHRHPQQGCQVGHGRCRWRDRLVLRQRRRREGEDTVVAVVAAVGSIVEWNLRGKVIVGVSDDVIVSVVVVKG